MSVINTGKSFSNGEQLTADKLNQTLSEATLGTDAFDGTSIQLTDVGSKLGVRDLGVSTAKLANDAVTTAKIEDANVTFAKLTDVIDDDTMATASATTLATSESIKAYVDDAVVDSTTGSLTANGWTKLPNGLIIQWGNNSLTSGGGQVITFPISFTTCFNVMGNKHGTDATHNLGITSFNNTGITVNPSGSGTFYWQAIGY